MSNRSPRPGWLRKEKKLSSEVLKVRRAIANLGLHTVCESARCPNMSECYCAGNATFLILGDHCTRNCAFCAVYHGNVLVPDPDEGKKIADYMKAMNIGFGVITSVTRDDLEDSGAAHFVKVVTDIKSILPEAKLELLVPDFQGRQELIEMIAVLPVEVFAHNIETVKALYSTMRRGADYERSLEVLQIASKERRPGILLKSGIMVGLGESENELERLFGDLANCKVDTLTIGQYLRPGRSNTPVMRYYPPDQFIRLKEQALRHGIKYVVSGPYVRSSYLAERNYIESLEKNV